MKTTLCRQFLTAAFVATIWCLPRAATADFCFDTFGNPVVCPVDSITGAMVPPGSTAAIFGPPTILFNTPGGGTLVVNVPAGYTFTPCPPPTGGGVGAAPAAAAPAADQDAAAPIDDRFDLSGADLLNTREGTADARTGLKDLRGLGSAIPILGAIDAALASRITGPPIADPPIGAPANVGPANLGPANVGPANVGPANAGAPKVRAPVSSPPSKTEGTPEEPEAVDEEFFRKLAEETRNRADEFRKLAEEARKIEESPPTETVREIFRETARRHEERARELDETAREFDEIAESYQFPDPFERAVVRAIRERSKALTEFLKARDSSDAEAIADAQRRVFLGERGVVDAQDALRAHRNGEPAPIVARFNDPLIEKLFDRERLNDSNFLREIVVKVVGLLEGAFDRDTLGGIIEAALDAVSDTKSPIDFVDALFAEAARTARLRNDGETARTIELVQADFLARLLADETLRKLHNFEDHLEIVDLVNDLKAVVNRIGKDLGDQATAARLRDDPVSELIFLVSQLPLRTFPLPDADAKPDIRSIQRVITQLQEELPPDSADRIIDVLLDAITTLEQIARQDVVGNDPLAQSELNKLLAETFALLGREAQRIADSSTGPEAERAATIANEARFAEARNRLAIGDAKTALELIENFTADSPEDTVRRNGELIRAILAIEENFENLTDEQRGALNLDQLSETKLTAFRELVTVTGDGGIALAVVELLEREGRGEEAIGLLDEVIGLNPGDVRVLAERLRLKIEALGDEVTAARIAELINDVAAESRVAAVAIALIDFAEAGDLETIEAIKEIAGSPEGISGGSGPVLDLQIAVAEIQARLRRSPDVTRDADIPVLIADAIEKAGLLDGVAGQPFISLLSQLQERIAGVTRTRDLVADPDAVPEKLFDELAAEAISIGQFEIAAEAIKRHLAQADSVEQFGSAVALLELLTRRLGSPTTPDFEKEKIEKFFEAIADHVVAQGDLLLEEALFEHLQEIDLRNEVIREAVESGDSASVVHHKNHLFDSLNDLRELGRLIAIARAAGDLSEDREEKLQTYLEASERKINDALNERRLRFAEAGFPAAVGDVPGTPRLTHLEKLVQEFQRVRETDPQRAFELLVEIRTANLNGETEVLLDFLTVESAFSLGIVKAKAILLQSDGVTNVFASQVSEEGRLAGALHAAATSTPEELRATNPENFALLEKHGFIVDNRFVIPEHVEFAATTLGSGFASRNTTPLDAVLSPRGIFIIAATIYVPGLLAESLSFAIAESLVAQGLVTAGAGEAATAFLLEAVFFTVFSETANFIIDPDSFDPDKDLVDRIIDAEQTLAHSLAVLGALKAFGVGTRAIEKGIVGQLAESATFAQRIQFRVGQAAVRGGGVVAEAGLLTALSQVTHHSARTREEFEANLVTVLLLRAFGAFDRGTLRENTIATFRRVLKRGEVKRVSVEQVADRGETTSADREAKGEGSRIEETARPADVTAAPQIPTLRIVLSDGRVINVGRRVGSGEFSDVFEVIGNPGLVVKISKQKPAPEGATPDQIREHKAEQLEIGRREINEARNASDLLDAAGVPQFRVTETFPNAERPFLLAERIGDGFKIGPSNEALTAETRAQFEADGTFTPESLKANLQLGKNANEAGLVHFDLKPDNAATREAVLGEDAVVVGDRILISDRRSLPLNHPRVEIRGDRVLVDGVPVEVARVIDHGQIGRFDKLPEPLEGLKAELELTPGRHDVFSTEVATASERADRAFGTPGELQSKVVESKGILRFDRSTGEFVDRRGTVEAVLEAGVELTATDFARDTPIREAIENKLSPPELRDRAAQFEGLAQDARTKAGNAISKNARNGFSEIAGRHDGRAEKFRELAGDAPTPAPRLPAVAEAVKGVVVEPVSDPSSILGRIDRQALDAVTRAGEPFSVTFIERSGLEPKKTVKVADETFHLSDPFLGPKDYQAVIAYREMPNGQVMPLTFYLSNSHGVFRVVTARTGGQIGKGAILYTDANGNRAALSEAMLSGGIGYEHVNEASANLVSELQPVLFDHFRQRPARSLDNPADAERAFYGHVQEINPVRDGDFMTRVEAGEAASEFEMATGRSTPLGELSEAQLPDMANPIRTSTIPMGLYEGAQSKLVPSRDGSLIYTVIKETTGEVFVSDIQPANSPVSSFGTRMDTLATDLTKPTIDYTDQLPGAMFAKAKGQPWPAFGPKGEYSRNMKHGNELTRYVDEHWNDTASSSTASNTPPDPVTEAAVTTPPPAPVTSAPVTSTPAPVKAPTAGFSAESPRGIELEIRRAIEQSDADASTSEFEPLTDFRSLKPPRNLEARPRWNPSVAR